MVHKKSEKRYLLHRKKLLSEEQRIVCQRDRLSKNLRDLRTSLRAWDNWLIQQ